MSDRVKYDELRFWVLDLHYDHCRANLFDLKEHHYSKLSSLNHIATNYDDTFEHPVEELMLNVILAILGEDCPDSWQKNCREHIDRILSKYPLENLLEQLESDEKDNFKLDLKALKIIE